MNLQRLVQSSFDVLMQYAHTAKVILFHPESRYRSLVVAKLLAEPPRPVFYYAMGAYDVNLPAFLVGLTHDLAEQNPTFGVHTIPLIKDAQPSKNLVAALRQDLAELADEPFFLILDDYDASEEAEDVQQVLEQLLLDLPENCQVIINSRSLPHLPWVAQVAKSHAVILGDDQLVMHDMYRMESAGELATLNVRCLGPSSITKNGQLIEDWEGHLPRLLLIFALERPVVTRTEICQAFWPNLDIDQAVNVFHVTKRRLHKALGFDALVHHDGYYQINPDVKINYDITQFVSALVKGRISGNDEEAAAAWQQAVDLYIGAFLQGHTEPWIVQQRDAYRLGYLEATLAIAKIRYAAGRQELALRLLIQTSQEHMDQEALHGEIMYMYVDLGRRSEAAAHYKAYRVYLQEKGQTPSQGIDDLYNTLMA